MSVSAVAASKDIAAMPHVLRLLLEAELAAGNEIEEVGHTFPAAPVGAYFRMTRAITTRARASSHGLVFRNRGGESHGGEFTDETGYFFILEPALPVPVEPDMDAIRAAHAPKAFNQSNRAAIKTVSDSSAPETAMRRFERSTVIDYEKWHDGTGYDLEALRALSAADRANVEHRIVARGVNDWRDVELLAELNSPSARQAIQGALKHSNPEIRNAVTNYAGNLVSDEAKTTSLIEGLKHATFFAGLSQTLDQVAEFHPPEIVAELFRGVLERPGEIAVHFAAMLCFVHRQTDQPFDYDQRPFFLRFNTSDRDERESAFRDLCAKIDVNPVIHLGTQVTRAPKQNAGPRFFVEVDRRGETITYSEPGRTANVVCTFGKPPCILQRTLASWWYSAEACAVQMTPEEKLVVLTRMAEACRRDYGISDITLER